MEVILVVVYLHVRVDHVRGHRLDLSHRRLDRFLPVPRRLRPRYSLRATRGILPRVGSRRRVRYRRRPILRRSSREVIQVALAKDVLPHRIVRGLLRRRRRRRGAVPLDVVRGLFSIRTTRRRRRRCRWSVVVVEEPRRRLVTLEMRVRVCSA